MTIFIGICSSAFIREGEQMESVLVVVVVNIISFYIIIFLRADVRLCRWFGLCLFKAYINAMYVACMCI